LHCPFCTSENTRVVDSRYVRDQNSTRRRRRCDDCERRFTTYERVEMRLPTVMKRDGRREAFDIGKIRAGIEVACSKRPISAERIDTFLDEIERHFMDQTEREVSSERVGQVVLDHLRGLDEVACVRFASVYREFSDVGQFLTELEALQSLQRSEGGLQRSEGGLQRNEGSLQRGDARPLRARADDR
jgi:transcriptional repressor NrdR